MTSNRVTEEVRNVAKAICAETCAHMGEPPCWSVRGDQGEELSWPPEKCDEPGCIALAQAAFAAAQPSERMAISVWKDGTYKLWAAFDASLAENEETWLATIPFDAEKLRLPNDPPSVAAQPSEDEVERVARVILNQRGFEFYDDPMEGGQNAYDLTCEAINEAREILAAIFSRPRQIFRAGDHVLHTPTDEKWVVAHHVGEYLSWCGWPEGEAKASDCHLVKAATDDEHVACLKELVAANAGKRSRKAIEALAALSPRPQAGMISADRACEIVGALIESKDDHFNNLVRVKDIKEAISTIRKEAGERPQAEGEEIERLRAECKELRKALASTTEAQCAYLLNRTEADLAASRRNYAEAIEALKALDDCYCHASDSMSRADRDHHRKVLIRARALVAAADAKGGEG
jgi:hypothetical protein